VFKIAVQFAMARATSPWFCRKNTGW